MKHLKWIFYFFALTFLGCASSKPNNVFLPVETSKTVPFFRNGIPIAAGYTDSTFILAAFEPTSGYVGNTYAIRLWILFKNYGHTPYLLKPLEHVSMAVSNIEKGTSKTVTPISPTLISATIENEKRAVQTLQIIAGTLKSYSAQPTTITDNSGNSWKYNDLDDKRDKINIATLNTAYNTAYWYDIYKASVYSGILKRNTVFYNESVNGYIYLPIERNIYHEITNTDIKKSTNYKFTINIQTPDGLKSIIFNAIPGE